MTNINSRPQSREIIEALCFAGVWKITLLLSSVNFSVWDGWMK